MKTTLFAAAALAQLAAAFNVGRHFHGHNHVHKRDVVDKDFVQFLSPEDKTYLQSKGVKIGKNYPCSSGQAVAVGLEGSFILELNNKAPHDIIVVSWSGSGQWGSVAAGFVGAVQPDITHTLKANTTTYFSYTPSKYNNGAGGDISGAIAPIYPGGGLTTFSGQVDDTWLEFTFTKDSQFSTTDVSRLINMNGHTIEAHNYKSKADRDNNAVQPACSTTNTICSYVCPGTATNCMWGSLLGCPSGVAGTTSNAAGTDGGCSGMNSGSGYTEVNFY